MEFLAQRSPCVGIGTAVEQKSSKAGVICLLQMIYPKVRLGHNAVEQWCVSAEAVTIHFSFGIHVSTAIEQLANNLQLVVINRDVQQRRAAERRGECRQ